MHLRCAVARLLCGALLVSMAWGGSPAWAVTAQEQSERLQNIYGFLLDLRSNSAPAPQDPGNWALQLDLLPMPKIDNRVGAKNEPVDALPAVPRLRGRIHGPLGLSLSLAGSPGIPFGKQTATFLQGDADWRVRWGSLLGGLRTSSSSWKIVGPITTTTHEDTFRIQQHNMDVRLGWELDHSHLYVGSGQGSQSSSLLIGEDGVTLNLREHAYTYRFAGLEFQGEQWDFNLEQHATESYLQHVQLSIRRRF
ncbi:MAG: hypothetical protein ACO4AU_05470 [bacterium]|jgi:hypothetical protein